MSLELRSSAMCKLTDVWINCAVAKQANSAEKPT
jgi:hypothetical protein